MTVDELIKQLSQIHNQNIPVKVYELDGDYWDDVELVRSADNGNEVQLVGKLGAELEATEQPIAE